MLGGKGAKGNTARDYNFKQANERLADQLNNSPELANQFGMEASWWNYGKRYRKISSEK